MFVDFMQYIFMYTKNNKPDINCKLDQKSIFSEYVCNAIRFRMGVKNLVLAILTVQGEMN